MVSSKFKEKFEKIIASNISFLNKIGITPNKLTLLGLLTSITSAWFYTKWKDNKIFLLLAASLLIISGLLDALDGVLARNLKKATKLGGFFDSVSDRYSDSIVLSAVTLSNLCQPLWGMASIIGSLMVSYVRAKAEVSDINMSSIGIAERAERMLFLSIITIIASFNIEALKWGIILLAFFTHFTVLQRITHFYKAISAI